MVFTDERRDYDNIKRPYLTVKHSVMEFVNRMVHINGMESLRLPAADLTASPRRHQ